MLWLIPFSVAPLITVGFPIVKFLFRTVKWILIIAVIAAILNVVMSRDEEDADADESKKKKKKEKKEKRSKGEKEIFVQDSAKFGGRWTTDIFFRTEEEKRADKRAQNQCLDEIKASVRPISISISSFKKA